MKNLNLNRMKSTTAKIATAFDVNVVVTSCLFGVISGNVGFRQVQEVSRRLKEVCETSLSLFSIIFYYFSIMNGFIAMSSVTVINNYTKNSNEPRQVALYKKVCSI